MRKVLTILVLAAIAAVGWFVWSRSNDVQTPANGDEQSFNKQQHSLTDPNSIWIIANKRRPLQPADYVPSDLVVPDVELRLGSQSEEMKLRAQTAAALEEMFAAAQKDRLRLMVSSAFRSADYQSGLYDRYVKEQGQAVADTQSARPGHSEHQTGLAVDVEPESRECEIEVCFADLPEGKWVAQNAYKYGFVVRYIKGKDHITGYTYEPWHLRYVGKSLATELKQKNYPTLEEFFGLEPAPDYQ
jgi:zinc D-Ala-D-Ala carboxypeptidase